MNIGILGSTGQTGRRVARYLSLYTDHTVTLLARNEAKLTALQTALAKQTGKSDFKTALVDLTDAPSLRSAFQPLDIVVIAISSASQLPAVLEAAIATQTDCLDVLLSSPEKHTLLKANEASMIKAGVCYVTDGGYHPGVPAALIRYAYSQVPDMTQAFVFGSFAVDWKNNPTTRETMLDFTHEMASMDMSALADGAWTNDWKNMKPFVFPDPIGRRDCIAMGMEEMRALPALIPSLRDAGFYIAGFGRMMDFVVMPLCLAALKLFPSSLPFVSSVLGTSLTYLASGNAWAVIALEAQGKDRALTLTLSHTDAYDFTAIPVVACIKQMAAPPKRAGLHLQAWFVEPARFLADMKRMGATIDEKPCRC